jgi:hypothetical protein
LGAGGRRFESGHPDQKAQVTGHVVGCQDDFQDRLTVHLTVGLSAESLVHMDAGAGQDVGADGGTVVQAVRGAACKDLAAAVTVSGTSRATRSRAGYGAYRKLFEDTDDTRSPLR